MSEVLDRIKQQYPQYADVPDDKLTAAIAEKYPAYLDRDPQFKEDYQKISTKAGVEASIGGVGTLVKTLTNPAAGEAAQAGAESNEFQRIVQEQPPRSGIERAARDYALAPGNVQGEAAKAGMTDPFIAIPRLEANSPVLRDTLTMEFGRAPTDDEAAAAAAVVNQVKGYAEFAESPLGLLTIGTGVLGKVAQKLVALAFAGKTAADVPKLARAAGEASVTGTPQQRYEAYLGLGQAVALPGVLTKAGLSGIARTAPATAEALVQAIPEGAKQARVEPEVTAAPPEPPKQLTAGEPAEKGPNAIQPESPQVLRTVQTQPEQGAGQVPAKEGGGEVSARGGEETQQQDVAKDRSRYDELVNQMKTKPDMAAWQEMETIKNRYAGKPPPKPEAPAAVKPTDLRPAIRTENGVVFGEYGDSHTDVLEANGLDKDKVDHFSPDRGFVDVNNPTKFLTRKEAEAMSGLTGKAEAGGLDSQDLPGAAMAKLERMLGEPVTAKEPEPQLQGMGGAVAGEFPEPRQAAVAGAQVEEAPPNGRPMGVISNFGGGLRNAINEVRLFAKGAAGDTMPRTTDADRVTGEAGARFLSSRIAAVPRADAFYARVLQDTGVDPIKFGAALTEDNLQSIRESQHIEAEKARAEGREEDALTADAKAQNVASIIGAPGSPFQTYDEFLDFVEDPMSKKAFDQHKQLWQEVIEPMYKEARGIDETVELPSRGLNTGARINLKAVRPEEDDVPVGKAVTGSSGLTGTFKRRTPFSFKAKGTGQKYDINYQEIIRNTFARQLEIANKNVFDKALVDTGNAVIDVPGRAVTLPDGGETVSFPLQRGFGARNIYVRKSLADEYEGAAGIGRKRRIPIVTPILNLMNRAAIAGLTEGTVHVSNQLTALFDRPASGKLLHDTLLSATGRADIPVIFTKAIIKAFQDNKQQLAELAEIGGLRAEYQHKGIFGATGRLLAKTDKLTRLLLDDTFKSLVKEGVVEDTETNRREYANQIGQYNKRAQGWIMRGLRETGLGPFATAGRTFNAMGIKMATLSPGAKATSPFAAAALRANTLSKWLGTAVLLAGLNWLLTHKKGGGMNGRPGTKTGDLDLGINNKNGKMLSIPLASILGVGRALRVTGLKGAIDAKRMGLSDSDAIDAAGRDILNSWIGPAAGPPVRFGMIAATGYPAAVSVGRASPVVPPGESQRIANVKEALREASPIYSTYDKIKKGASWDEILNTQFPRLSPVPGKTEATVKNYPQIVKAAQANEFIDFVVHETRKQDPDKRLDYATEQIKRLPPEFQKKAWNEMKRRRVFAQ